jgi:hypothetical protein
MRCATLAEEWIASRRGDVALWGQVSLPLVERRLREIGVEVWKPESGPGRREILLVDTYDEIERERCARVDGFSTRVLVDDIGGRVPDGYAGVWNPNPVGDRKLNPGFAGAFIGGPDAVPIRAGLPSWSGAGQQSVGVLLGAGVPRSGIREGLDVARRLLEGWVFCGAGDWVPPNWRRADPDSPWRELAQCGVVVITAGTTLWECASVGAPSVVLCIAANQLPGAMWARERGVPVVNFLEITDSAQMGRALVDAVGSAKAAPRLRSGVAHVVEFLGQLSKATETTH